MALDYHTWFDQITRIVATDAGDVDFSAQIPGIIDYAEQRIYRDLNLLSTRIADQTGALTPNSRSFSLPSDQGTFITVTAINVITPAGVTTIGGGVRNSIPGVTRNLLDYISPGEQATTSPSLPVAFYMRDDKTAILGPAPDAAYYLEVIGTIRPTPLSEANPSTFLTAMLPDLFVAASMVYVAGYMRNFGSQSDDPRMALSWEAQYNSLLASAKEEELRRKFAQEFARVGSQQPQ